MSRILELESRVFSAKDSHESLNGVWIELGQHLVQLERPCLQDPGIYSPQRVDPR